MFVCVCLALVRAQESTNKMGGYALPIGRVVRQGALEGFAEALAEPDFSPPKRRVQNLRFLIELQAENVFPILVLSLFRRHEEVKR